MRLVAGKGKHINTGWSHTLALHYENADYHVYTEKKHYFPGQAIKNVKLVFGRNVIGPLKNILIYKIKQCLWGNHFQNAEHFLTSGQITDTDLKIM